MTDKPTKVVRTGAQKPPNAGKGRAKGVPNKTTQLLKDAILLAAEQVGFDGRGKDGLTGYLKFVAGTDVKAFATLIGKVLPMQLVGEGDGPVVIEIRRYAQPTE